MELIEGKVLMVEDNISGDEILHARYSMLPNEEMAEHIFEDLDEGLSKKSKEAEILLAGINFGCGTGRESSARVIKAAGFKAVIAESFSRIFFRNLINQGILAIKCPGIRDSINDGDIIKINMEENKIIIKENEVKKYNPFPEIIKNIISAGGIVNLAKQ